MCPLSADSLPRTPFTECELPLPDRRAGKVRVSYALAGGRRLFVTTDRLSAFDRVLAGVPFKGQVLNQLAAWWFRTTADLVPNHLLDTPDPNATVAVAAQPLPVEVVVRGHITGVTSTSLWRQYADGQRVLYGHRLPEGLRKNEPLPTPLVTPTTKAEAGTGHDQPISCADVTARGLVAPDVWDQVQAAALAVFDRGRAIAHAAGLILADTKYEFGLGPDGSVLLIDEVHTPDSSRYWIAATYAERLAAGEEPESLDKEPVRQALAAAGYTGEGEPPALDPSVWTTTAQRYVEAYERLTSIPFEPGSYPVLPRLLANLQEHDLL
jgi:phosphoribosylaminoimidazole-succinocarboxamide synthase